VKFAIAMLNHASLSVMSRD